MIWLEKNSPVKQAGVITKDELAAVKSLTVPQLVSPSEADLKVFLPSLETIIFDLQSSCDYDSKYTIPADNLNYAFLGSSSAKYKIFVCSNKRTNLNLSFENIMLEPSNAIALDMSSVENAQITFKGNCVIKSANVTIVALCNGILVKNY